MEAIVVEADGARLHVGVTGTGADVVVLSGGPGCVHYLEKDELAPRGTRTWFPEPRGGGRSTGSAHDMEQAITDLEAVRRAAGVDRWVVLGHSWGCELGTRYAVEHPTSVAGVIGVAGTGPQRDRTWSAAYEAAKSGEPVIDIPWVPQVHAALLASFNNWIHSRRLWRDLADCPVPMHFVAAADDVRPSWPLEQLADLLPKGSFEVVPNVPHDFWSTHPTVWTDVVSRACAEIAEP